MGYNPLVLVVEDDDVNRELIKDILTDYGYRVDEAVNGQEAVTKATSAIPDLIIMDIQMPVMNGREAIRLLMENPETNRIPIIVLTGMNETTDRIKAFDSGAMDFVAKPFNAHELLSHVRSYLRFSLLNKKYVLSTLNSDTKLPNRAAFREKLPEIDSPKLFLMKIEDIDSISRFYGEAMGTKIDKEFAVFLINYLQQQSEELKNNSFLYHLGKGLFGLLLDDASAQTSVNAGVTRCRHLMDQFNTHQNLTRDVQYDLELAMVFSFERDNILEKCELALEETIRNKTGIIMVDDMIKDVYHTIGENIYWLRKIKEAAQDKRFIPHFQPILNSFNGKVEKYESLLRMVDEQGEIVPPGKFLFIAKNSKYYFHMTRLMTLQSMAMFKDRHESFSINISALDIENRGMREFLLNCLENSPDLASRMIFELVEQEGVKYLDTLKEFVQKAKSLGVKIAIDDFGSGYSNFSMLMDMDVDFIKIDGSLIRNIHTDASSRSVVETIKMFAEKNRIDIIAEFVENEQIFKTLKEIGIKYFQGYYIGKPGTL